MCCRAPPARGEWQPGSVDNRPAADKPELAMSSLFNPNPQLAPAAGRDGSQASTPPRTASVLGLGHYLPTEVVPNESIAGRIGVDDDWIVKRTGNQPRRRAAPHERLT